MHVVRTFRDREYPVDTVVHVCFLRSDYKVMLRAMLRYLDHLMEVKAEDRTVEQDMEIETVNDILWSFHQEVGPNLFWDSGE